SGPATADTPATPRSAPSAWCPGTSAPRAWRRPLLNFQLRDLVQDPVDLPEDLPALVGQPRHVLAEPFVLLAKPAQRLGGPAHGILELSQSFDPPLTHSSLAR